MTISKKKFDDLNDRVEIINELRRLSGGRPLTYWRGRPVVSVSKWESMFSSNRRQALEYIPDGFTNLYENAHLLVLIVRELSANELDMWKQDYIAYLEKTGNPVLGNSLCDGCILKPADDPFGLRKIIGKEQQLEMSSIKTKPKMSSRPGSSCKVNIDSRSSNSTDDVSSQISFPCTIVNRFKCPYKDSPGPNDDKGLIEIGKAIALVQGALAFASELVNGEEVPDTFAQFEVDFKEDQIKSSNAEFHTGSLEDLPLPRSVAVNSIAEIHAALTNPDTLDRLLKQYFSSENQEMNLKHLRREIIEVIMRYKECISVQNLRDGVGGNLEDSDEQTEKLKERRTSTAWKGATCCICHTNICHIKCSNCGIYMCNNHWFEHMKDKHPATALRNSGNWS